MDFVTEESQRAGKNAGRYVKNLISNQGRSFETSALDGISYIVPQKVRLDNIEDKLDIFLRVRGIYNDAKLVLKADDEVIKEYNKRHLAPGEMEHLILPKTLFDGKDFKTLTIEVKEAN